VFGLELRHYAYMQNTAVDETIDMMSLAMQFFSERDKVMGLLCMGVLVLCV